MAVCFAVIGQEGRNINRKCHPSNLALQLTGSSITHTGRENDESAVAGRREVSRTTSNVQKVKMRLRHSALGKFSQLDLPECEESKSASMLILGTGSGIRVSQIKMLTLPKRALSFCPWSGTECLGGPNAYKCTA